MDWSPQSPDLNPIQQIWCELENKLDRSIVHSKKSLWLELQKECDNISVEVLRKYIDTVPERCAAVIDRSQRPALLSYCCHDRQTMPLSHYTRSHAVKNTSQSKEETDNTPTEKTEHITSDMKQGLRTLSF